MWTEVCGLSYVDFNRHDPLLREKRVHNLRLVGEGVLYHQAPAHQHICLFSWWVWDLVMQAGTFLIHLFFQFRRTETLSNYGRGVIHLSHGNDSFTH